MRTGRAARRPLALLGIPALLLAAACTGTAPGDPDASTTPTSEIAAIRSISAGGYHTCAVDPDGLASCWGLGDYGQLGTGSTETDAVPAPVAVPDGVRFAVVAAGNAHTCAIDTEGAVWCWGVDLDGGDEADRNATHGPERVELPGGTRITAIDGIYHSCALDADGVVWCWGRGTEGQLGDGTSTDATRPVRVRQPDGVIFTGIATGAFHTCALGTDGSVWCWGRDIADTPERVTLPDGIAATALTAGFAHTCVLTEEGGASCWGDGGDGQLGDGAATDVPRPVAVAMPDGVRFTAIDAGNAHTCAVATDGSVWCWGLGIQGGATDAASTEVPTLVIADGDATAISAGGFHACALLGDGTTWCWGDDSLGQLGDGTMGRTSTPIRVAA